jgi:hypothetical protein
MLTPDIEPTMPNNSALFKDDFYSRFSLRPHTLQLNETIEKTYMFPTFYGNVTQVVAIYLCSYERACELLPHPKLKPVSMGKGRSLVIFSCYEYKQVHQVSPYNEIAMTLPVLANPSVNIPILPMVIPGLFKKFGYYVFSMPVTSHENQIRGNKLWGLPKVTQEIDFRTEDGFHICNAREEDGEPYFELKVPMIGKTMHCDESGYLYSQRQGSMLKSKTCFTGTYNITKYMDRLFTKAQAQTDHLWLGDTPCGNRIRNLELDSHPFQFRYAEHVRSCFDLPDTSQAEFLKTHFG